jgi:hypothetical protein
MSTTSTHPIKARFREQGSEVSRLGPSRERLASLSEAQRRVLRETLDEVA